MSKKTYLRFSDWLNQANLRLAEVGVEKSQLDAEYLVSFVTGIPRLHLSLHKNNLLSKKQYIILQTLLDRRISREPLQYILNHVDFHGLDLHINRNVLIPRPETEFLVNMIIRENMGISSILDIGTGSGAIALALKQAFPFAFILGTDVSLPALRMAIANARRLHLPVKFKKSDVYASITDKFDIIVSNPPYLTESEYLNAAPELVEYEPKIALQAEENGLEVYRRMLEKASEHLLPKGQIYLEIGHQQAASISFLAQKCGFTTVEIKQDLNGFDRYLIIRT